MADLKTPKLIIAKGFLFFGLGLLAAWLLVWEAHGLKVTLLLLVTIWAFCRSYYFAFYVIEHYVDPSYRFSGLLSFALYMLRKHGD